MFKAFKPVRLKKAVLDKKAIAYNAISTATGIGHQYVAYNSCETVNCNINSIYQFHLLDLSILLLISIACLLKSVQILDFVGPLPRPTDGFGLAVTIKQRCAGHFWEGCVPYTNKHNGEETFLIK